jgi:hypothetical protein
MNNKESIPAVYTETHTRMSEMTHCYYAGRLFELAIDMQRARQAAQHRLSAQQQRHTA